MGLLKPSLGRRESVKDNEWPVRGGGGTGASVRPPATSKSAGGLESSDDDLTGEGDFLGERAR